jgi:hypothetical protein
VFYIELESIPQDLLREADARDQESCRVGVMRLSYLGKYLCIYGPIPARLGIKNVILISVMYWHGE